MSAKKGKPNLVLLHGLGGSKGDWKDVATSLSRSFDVLALDLPGAGDAPKPENGYEPAALAIEGKGVNLFRMSWPPGDGAKGVRVPENDGLPVANQPFGLRISDLLRIRQLLLDRKIPIEIAHVLARADRHGDERPAFRRFTELLDANHVARLGQRVEVRDYRAPVQ